MAVTGKAILMKGMPEVEPGFALEFRRFDISREIGDAGVPIAMRAVVEGASIEGEALDELTTDEGELNLLLG